MQTPKSLLRALYSPQRSPGPVRHVSEWISELGKEVFSVLEERKALIPVAEEELDGLEAFADFGEGRKPYRFETRPTGVTAWPKDEVGKAHQISSQSRSLFRADPEKTGQAIAGTNGFLMAPLPTGEVNFFLMRRKIGSKDIAAVFCLNPFWFTKEESWALLEKIIDSYSHIVFIFDEWNRPIPWKKNGASPFLLETNLLHGLFQIPRGQYCHPKYGISAAEAREIFSEKQIVVDPLGTSIFLRGEKLAFQGAGQAFEYLCGVCRMTEERVSAAEFCTLYLQRNTVTYDYATHVRQIRKQVSTRLESSFKDDPEMLTWAKAMFLASDKGEVIRPFPLAEVLYWNEFLSDLEK